MPRASILIALVTVLAGCATAVEQERACFTSLAIEYVASQEEVLRLESIWRASLSGETGPDDARTAYRRLQEAQTKRQPTREWYERLFDRLQLRSEEEEMMTHARLLLFTGPGALLYPVVHWNLREVLWDGADPDADTDPVKRYCMDRLAGASEEVEEVKVEAKLEREPESARLP
jgi:hypothetical protein